MIQDICFLTKLTCEPKWAKISQNTSKRSQLHPIDTQAL